MLKNIEWLRKLFGSEQVPLNAGADPQHSLATEAAEKRHSGKVIAAVVVLTIIVAWSFTRDTKPAPAGSGGPSRQNEIHHPGEPLSPNALRQALNAAPLPSNLSPQQPTDGDLARANMALQAYDRQNQRTAAMQQAYAANPGSPGSQFPPATATTVTPDDPIRAEEAKQRLSQKQREYASLFSSPVVRVGDDAVKPPASAVPSPKPEEADPPEEDTPSRLSFGKQKEGLKDCTDVAGPDNETRYCLPEGTIIPARLETRAVSEAVGPVNAIVARDVYSRDRQHVLIPSGAQLLGKAHGSGGGWQERMMITFHRMLMPDGRSVDLEEGLGLDQYGAIGVKDKVNRHIPGKILTVVGLGSLSALSSVGTTSVYTGTYEDALRQGMGQQAAMLGQQMMSRQLSRPNTLTIEEGKVLDLRLSQDIYLREWGSK